MKNISVVIPYYGTGKTILRTVDNVIKEGIKQDQILIVDDFSGNRFVNQIIKKYPKIQVIFNDANVGEAASRNIGINNTTSEYILFIDSDMYFLEGQLKKLIGSMGSYDIVSPKITDDDGRLLTPKNTWEEENCMCAAVFIVKRKSLFKLNEFFDENYKIYLADSDFFLRCKTFGLKVKYCPTVIFSTPKRLAYSEEKYYLRVRNLLYFSFKFIGIIPYRMPILLYALGFTSYNFAIALLNRHIELSPLRVRFDILYTNSQFSRRRLLYHFFRAILWNIMHIPTIFQKRLSLKRALRKKVLI